MPTCKEVMTTDVMTCPASTTLVGVASLLANENVGSLPVVNDDDTLIGIISDRDIVVRAVAENRHPLETTAEEVMSRDLQTCHPEDDLERALDQMSRSQVRRVPIVDQHNRVVGIIAQADIALRTDRAREVGHVVEDISRSES